MQIIIKSRSTKKNFKFYANAAGGHIYLEDFYNPYNRTQICEHGNLTGETLSCTDHKDFSTKVYRWYKSHMAKYKSAYLNY